MKIMGLNYLMEFIAFAMGYVLSCAMFRPPSRSVHCMWRYGCCGWTPSLPRSSLQGVQGGPTYFIQWNLYVQYIVADSFEQQPTMILLYLSSVSCTLSMQGIFLECTYLFDDDGTQVNHLHYFIVFWGLQFSQHVPCFPFNISKSSCWY